MPPPDPLTRLGLARSPAMKLLRPTQEQMNDISMPESFRNFVIEQQGIQGNQDAIQRAALQEQNALVAEQAAQEYFSQPATARERFLADNPQAYASSAGPGIYREQMMQNFLTLCIGPWLARVEEWMSGLLPRGTVVKFRSGGLLRADTETRYRVYEIALQNGILTRDEVRALEDLPPLGEAADA